MGGGNAAAHKSLKLVRPDLNDVPVVQRILAGSAPGAKALFEEAMRLMNSGRFPEAREAFQELIKTYPDDKVKAPASWAIGLTYIQEGGTANLHQAANQLLRFLDSFGSNDEAPELVHAAMLDIPVILMELMHTAPSAYERQAAAALAVKTITAYLAKWPDSPQAPAAQASLVEAHLFLTNPR